MSDEADIIVTVDATVPITVRKISDGLYRGTSEVVPGIYVGAKSVDAVREAAPEAIANLTRYCVANPTPEADKINRKRLECAAPEMLEALNGFVLNRKHLHTDDPFEGAMERLFNLAEATIAKARGEKVPS